MAGSRRGERRGGRQKGVPNKRTAVGMTLSEVRAAALKIIDHPVYRLGLEARIRDGRAPQMEILLWHYGYGKPKDIVEHSGVDGAPLAIHHHFSGPGPQ